MNINVGMKFFLFFFFEAVDPVSSHFMKLYMIDFGSNLVNKYNYLKLNMFTWSKNLHMTIVIIYTK